ncbi:helix-turn-helix domain-containing protein [Planococcus shenhongbingii]|uniref:Helix-turn-helix domain-containing protein n=1 Tax=Planococcus shenhongbingii TaxID=3058398 RepID=A0ABT8NBG2_9BACL|nr:helix-turn-helix domain-containing protein [Planococcus sp. N017]MDN7245222.1 helix-turn-helix domain-containing protein [Planococcus sp. N017]
MGLKSKQLKLSDVFNSEKETAVTELYDRVITIPIEARTALKKELFNVIGRDRTKGVFTRYGWHCGVNDGEKAKLFEWEDVWEAVYAGPKFHRLHGYLDKVEILELRKDGEELEFIDVLWVNTFEAEQYLKESDLSTEPVCHTLCGYVSGYLSTVIGQPIMVKEVECRAMGHAQCKCICMPIEKWGDEIASEQGYYQGTSIIKELDEVTEKLKTERDHLTKANDIHQRLIEELLSKQGVQKIVDILYETTGLTAFIEDENHQILVQAGHLDEPLDLQKFRSKHTLFTRYSDDISLLRAPIFYEQQVKGYCSFVYSGQEEPNELDYMIIEKAGLTSAIILLNENIKINTEQNIKRSFLNDILESRLTEEEIYKVSYYLNFDSSSSYWMLTIDRNRKEIENEIAFNEELIRSINLFLKERNINAIVSQKLDKIIVLIEYPSFEKLNMAESKFIDHLFKYCLQRFSKYNFCIGVSTVIQKFMDITLLYKETLAALRAKKEGIHVSYFKELGIESVLFQIQDEVLIERFVDQHIGKLLAIDKEFDLIKTLYAYISNGNSINNTSKALSMSISGLRYRLVKISEILNQDLADTQAVFSIYLAINILKSKGTISI